MRKYVLAALLMAVCLMAACLPGMAEAQPVKIILSDAGVTVNGAPAAADTGAAVYVANDIVFYLAGQDFTYGEGSEADAHEQSEADAHTVVHIAQPGVYEISGALSYGQIAVDLGKDARKDPEAVVTLIFNGADINCEVAPAVIFYNVYECGDDDEETAVMDVDTSAAGANVVIADGSENELRGAYVARIYESVELNEDGTEIVDSKKLHKYDGALHSKMSMNISGGEIGDGVLNIVAENEGLCSDLHLTIDGGVIYIDSGNDGINTSEDNVSVCTVNGGVVDICVNGGTGEGDGIDSNGWLVINGGTVISAAYGRSADAGIDSDRGIHINGGYVAATGNMLDAVEGGTQTYAVFGFASPQKGGSSYQLKNADGETVAEWTPENDFTYLVASSDAIVPGTYTFWNGDTQLAGAKAEMRGTMAMGVRPPEGMEMPEGFGPPEDSGNGRPPEGVEMPEGMDPPEGFGPPEDSGNGRPPESVEMPEGMDPPGDFGPRGGQHPEKFGGRGFGGPAQQGELSAEFVIGIGGNMFASVSPANIK